MSTYPGVVKDTQPELGPPKGRFSNGWAILPLRIFLASIFLFGAYAKLTYPGFSDPNSTFGFKSAVENSKADSPISGLLGPMTDHVSVFAHITAFAELAIGLGLLVGLLTRIAALGGMVLSALIVLSINWNSVKEYTGNGGWFTSVDLAVIAGLSVFLLGGAGPLSLDRGYVVMRWRQRQSQQRKLEAEPRFTDPQADLEDARWRLRGEVPPGTYPDYSTQQLPSVPPPGAPGAAPGSYPPPPPEGQYSGYPTTEQPQAEENWQQAAQRGQQDSRPQDQQGTWPPDRQESRPQAQPSRPPAEPDSLWNEGRRDTEQRGS